MSKVVVERNHGLVWVTLNRPYKRNAVDYDVMEELDQVLDEVEDNQDDKVLVITGQGNEAFCSGGDVALFQDLYTKKQAFPMLSKMGKVLYRLFFFPKPTVAAINGTAVGGGCELATACDFRVAASTAKIGFVQGTLGITTGWGGSTLLYERLPATVAMELLMTCKVMTAQHANETGFVQHVVSGDDFRADVESYLRPYTRQSVAVLQAYKKRFTDSYDKAEVKERFYKEIDHCSTLWASDEHHEAVERFLNKSTASK
ncbi:enoyl-CoA hydratase/isomerase family protein [Desertibacillus haloalkaliphilus]|uniref:enoyl-CoA hydratase/isomerase family protein n=1 Tax=Desertibacillus haloalkaliphilus TaxID=1328930 RepID=UPI001C25E8EE|nr:enoyl-CoA hydratase/isomerase family protein [Desertibacillus haloalkaliphilus]MBU8907126.1 enoyl-CoA hydratase/isomerase family protein [Desertibacillus haloalkaliphilus]